MFHAYNNTIAEPLAFQHWVESRHSLLMDVRPGCRRRPVAGYLLAYCPTGTASRAQAMRAPLFPAGSVRSSSTAA